MYPVFVFASKAKCFTFICLFSPSSASQLFWDIREFEAKNYFADQLILQLINNN